VISVKIAELEGAEEMKVGQRAYLQNMYGQPIPVRVTEMDDTMITFDANHELAGKELNFEIELISVED
jgi:FKBP-type peptidyl-prolyl cis-trans isomerase 2